MLFDLTRRRLILAVTLQLESSNDSDVTLITFIAPTHQFDPGKPTPPSHLKSPEVYAVSCCKGVYTPKVILGVSLLVVFSQNDDSPKSYEQAVFSGP